MLREVGRSACDRQVGSQCAVAALFGIGRAFVEKLRYCHRTTGEIAPKPRATFILTSRHQTIYALMHENAPDL